MAAERLDSKDNISSVEEKKSVIASCQRIIESHLPIIGWLPNYKWKEYFMGDLMAGLTIGCLHVPQSLAFATLAKADPIYGLYTSCFSVVIYCFLGTAIISSFGPVAVASILTGEAVANYSGSDLSNNELVSAITLLVGVYYFVGYALRFSVVTKLFTKYLTSSFVLACCIQIIVKSIKTVLGIRIPEERGYFSVIFNVFNTFKAITDTNFVTLSVSIVVLLVFCSNTYFIRPLIKKYTNFILPMEILVIIVVTALSYLLKFDDLGVELIGYVPTGFPVPNIPSIDALSVVWVDALIISVVNFSTTLSMTLMFNKDLRPDQELFALSLTNIVCSAFQTLPFGNSMMRTAVAQSCGIKTLLCSIVSSVFILFVILFAGPLFSLLPKCVLGCVIVYGLSLLMITKVKEIPQIFKSGFENSIIWIVTFLVSVLVSIQLGLLSGFVLTSRQFLADKPVESSLNKKEDLDKGDSKETPEQQHLLELNTGTHNKGDSNIV